MEDYWNSNAMEWYTHVQDHPILNSANDSLSSKIASSDDMDARTVSDYIDRHAVRDITVETDLPTIFNIIAM